MSDVGKAISSLPRVAILQAAESSKLQHLVQKHGKRVGATRFVAGETLDECVAVLRRLNDDGPPREHDAARRGDARRRGRDCGHGRVRVDPRAPVAEKLRANVALKLTHLGLSFDEEVAYANVERLVAKAGELGTFVRIDMESSDYVEVTLRIYERLRDAGHDSVGTVLQSYLYRTPDDLERLLPRQPNLRIVKGAYLEPETIAYPEKRDVDRAYLELVERGLREGAYIAVATHDETIIRKVQAFAARESIPRDRFEFQMLYGVRPGAAALDRGRGLQGARRVAVRAGLVPVPDATARGASGERGVLPEEPRPAMSALPASAEVVVVGGGVIGTSTAFHLAEAGVDVCLVERDGLAAGSTSRAAGGIRAQFSDPLNIAIGLRSIDAFTRFGERPGAEIDLHQVGYLFLLDREEDVASFEASMRLQNELGVPSRFVDLAEAAELCPIAGLDGVLAATYCALDGHASPEAVVQGYAAGARAHGASVLTGCAGLGHRDERRRDHRRRDGARHDRDRHRRLRRRRLVAGDRAAPSASSSPSSRTCARSGSPARHRRSPIVSRSRSTSRPASTSTARGPDCCSAWPTPSSRRGSTHRPTRTGSRRSWRSPTGGCPALLDMGIAGGWKGYYEITPDHNALVGESSEASRFLYATGFSGHGFLQGPAVGEIVRDLVLRPRAVRRRGAALRRPLRARRTET